jgi:hypothetical protein
MVIRCLVTGAPKTGKSTFINQSLGPKCRLLVTSELQTKFPQIIYNEKEVQYFLSDLQGKQLRISHLDYRRLMLQGPSDHEEVSALKVTSVFSAGCRCTEFLEFQTAIASDVNYVDLAVILIHPHGLDRHTEDDFYSLMVSLSDSRASQNVILSGLEQPGEQILTNQLLASTAIAIQFRYGFLPRIMSWEAAVNYVQGTFD